MKKRITTGIIIIGMICVVLFLACCSSQVGADITEEKYTKEELTTLITEAQSIKDNAHTMADSARNLGWEEDDKLLKQLQKKWHDADLDQKKYQEKLDIILAEEAEAARKAEEERIAAEKAAQRRIERKRGTAPAA